VKVGWTEAAHSHLVAIHAYIAQASPRYAQVMVDRITRRAEQCGKFPLAGARVPEFDDDVREVLELPYRIIYRIRAERLDVIAVIHGARLLPPGAC
jgi:toxin ParE1/3/4